jgi:hypothetical protein
VVDALPFSVIDVSLMGNTLDRLKRMKTIDISFFAGTGVVFLGPDKLLASSRCSQFDNLQIILNRFRGQNCFDPRDHVYGILGLISGSQIDGGIAVDYESSVEDVYKATTRHIIQSTNVLEIICNAVERKLSIQTGITC